MSRPARWASYALVLVLTVELAVWGAFLVGARPFGQAFPLAALVALVGNLVVGVAGGRVLGRQAGAVLPGVIWLVIALALGTRKQEGDVVVTSSLRGLAFLVTGAVAAVVAVGLADRAATPRGPAGR